jgi:predicted transcriptional regulator YdeE
VSHSTRQDKGEKDKFAVSNIRIDKLENDDRSMIEELIKNLFTSDINQVQDNSLESINDFRKDIYSKWFNTLKDNNFNLKLEKSHNNHDIFIATNSKDKIKFQVWYGTSVSQKTKGFINLIIVTEKSNDDLANNLKSWLL